MAYYCSACKLFDEKAFRPADHKCVPAQPLKNFLTASNNASNIGPASNDRVSASNESASNSAQNEGQTQLSEKGSVAGAASKKQRWDREAYNAYQREYMRKRRAG